METLMARDAPNRTTLSENTIKTVDWLVKSVTELRSEIDQINSQMNLTGSFQQSEDIGKQISLIQV